LPSRDLFRRVDALGFGARGRGDGAGAGPQEAVIAAASRIVASDRLRRVDGNGGGGIEPRGSNAVKVCRCGYAGSRAAHRIAHKETTAIGYAD
jgi:hypothetical protein